MAKLAAAPLFPLILSAIFLLFAGFPTKVHLPQAGLPAGRNLLRNEIQPPGLLDGLRPPLHIQLREQILVVRFDRAQGNENLFRDFFVAESLRHQVQNFQLALADFQLFNQGSIRNKIFVPGDVHFFFHHHRLHLRLRKFQSEPYPQGRKQHRNGADVNLVRMLVDDEPQLEPPEQEQEHRQAEGVEEGGSMSSKKGLGGGHGTCAWEWG